MGHNETAPAELLRRGRRSKTDRALGFRIGTMSPVCPTRHIHVPVLSKFPFAAARPTRQTRIRIIFCCDGRRFQSVQPRFCPMWTRSAAHELRLAHPSSSGATCQSRTVERLPGRRRMGALPAFWRKPNLLRGHRLDARLACQPGREYASCLGDFQRCESAASFNEGDLGRGQIQLTTPDTRPAAERNGGQPGPKPRARAFRAAQREPGTHYYGEWKTATSPQ